MRATTAAALVVFSSGCFGDVHQIAGTGATYLARCSGPVKVQDEVYRVSCTPDACAKRYVDVADNHVVVTWVGSTDTLVGYRERVCVQDLSDAIARFAPVPDEAVPPADAPR